MGYLGQFPASIRKSQKRCPERICHTFPKKKVFLIFWDGTVLYFSKNLILLTKHKNKKSSYTPG